MAFIAIASQRALLQQEYNFVQFQKTKVMRMAQNAAEKARMIVELNSEDDEWEEEKDPDYCYYHQLDEEYQAESDSLDTQLESIKQMIDSEKTLVQNGMKQSCTLNLSGS